MKFKVPTPPTDMFRFRNPLRRSFSQEVQQLPQGSIVVQLYGDVDSLEADCLVVESRSNHIFTAEELCITAARKLKIGPLALHLFALTTPDRSQWFPPNEKITCPETGHIRFLFRMRLRPHMNHLEGLSLGLEAFEYFFLQVRDDFVNDVLQAMIKNLERERVLGLGVTDVHRFGKQEHLTMSDVQDVDPTRFIPKSVAESFKNVRKMLLKNGFKSELKKEYGSSVEPRKLKFQYINGILCYVPSYAIESFTLKDVGKDIVVDPFHPKFPGVYLHSENNGDEHVCDMNDILDISFWAEEARVQINRYHAMPRIFVFKSAQEARSFIALVDGYRRLTVDFYFHVTSHINSPTVELLCRHRLHGPVSKDWAKITLQDYNKETPNVNYLVRQRSNSINDFILIFIRPGDPQRRVNMLSINKLDNDKFQIAVSNEPIFENIADLLRYYESGDHQVLPLKTRLGPSMLKTRHGTSMGHAASADDSGLFLCKEPRILEEAEEEYEEEVAKRMMPTMQQQRSNVRIVSGVSLCPERLGSGQFTEVYKGFWNKDSKNIQAVAVKQLRAGAETAKTYQALMETVHIMSFWSNATIVSALDICLHKFQMLEELAELGTLEEYLQSPHHTLYIQHLVTAAEQISQALRYLQEECRGASSQVHGNIRSRNILVFDHNQDLLKVKLGDPGMLRLYTSEGYLHPYNLERLPWLAPELYASVRNMTTHSDRYAFGITLWEIFSLGDRPFLHIRQDMVEKLAKSGKCLDRPKKCPQEIYEVMTRCWCVNPADRVGAKEIVRDIRNISQGMDRMLSRSEAESHYSMDNVGDLPEQAMVIMRHGRSSQGGEVNRGLSDDMADGAGGGAGTSPLTSVTGSSNSTTALLGPDWSGATNLTPLLGAGYGATGPHGQEPRPLPDQPGIEYILKREELKVDLDKKPLGQGYYGKVHIGVYGAQRVAVKSLRRMNLASHTRAEFEHEFRMMIKLKHENIVNIIGQCPQRSEGAPMLLVMEYVENGCLMNYLRERLNKIDPKTMLRFAREVAQGMYYLSSQSIVHRDLASRNVLVSDNITMKISDFGLSRLIDPDRNYYKCQRKDTEMPLRWCAPESLLYQKFSSMSDVWSYGITVWEIFKFGAPPILCEDKHIHTELYHGKRLPQPDNCPRTVYVDLMFKCWEYYPKNRPQFQDLVVKANELMDQADLFLSPEGASMPRPADWELPKRNNDIKPA